MSLPPANDTRKKPILFREPDPHGQAALLLAESTLHALVEKRTISSVDAASITRTAVEVKREVAVALGESRETMQASIDLLSKIEDSFLTASA